MSDYWLQNDMVNYSAYFIMNKCKRIRLQINIYIYNLFKSMRMNRLIKIIAVKTDLTMGEIARRLNRSPQSFSQKCKRNSLTLDDLKDIAMVTGCKFTCSFILPDGEKIEIGEKYD